MYVCGSLYLLRMSSNTACNFLLQMNLCIVQLLCLYMHVYLFVSISCSVFLSFFLSSYIYIYTSVFIYISLYICISYMPISVYYFLYLSGTFLAHVLRPNSFHRCSNFTSHCRSFISLPQKRLRKHARAFYFSACFLFPHSCDL